MLSKQMQDFNLRKQQPIHNDNANMLPVIFNVVISPNCDRKSHGYDSEGHMTKVVFLLSANMDVVKYDAWKVL